MLILFYYNYYYWIYLHMAENQQDSEYALGPKYVKILNMVKFWIWQGSQYVSVKQSSEYEYARVTKGSKYATI